MQDQTAEQRAKRRRLLSAAQTARIRKGLIRYVQLVRAYEGQGWSCGCIGAAQACCMRNPVKLQQPADA
jgi:hypothetical protein